MRPLVGALVGVLGAGSATSDAKGRFRIPDVPTGGRTIVVAHPMLDTVGLSGLTRHVGVTTGRDRVMVAVPSFATLWKVACGTTVPLRDQALLYGSIRDADGAPIPDARVELTWVETSVLRKKEIRQQRLRTETVADSTGSYGVCGVPSTSAIRVQASAGATTTGTIDVFPSDLRIVRQDLVVAAADGSARGIVVGRLSDPMGMPVREARVLVADMPEVRSDADGRFAVRDVPVGTRQLEVLSIGMLPVMATIDVRPGDTATVALQLAKVTTLAVVNITASARARRFISEFEERRVKSLGYLRDSTAIAGRGTMTGVFAEFPSVRVHAGRVSSDFFLTLPSRPRGTFHPLDGRCVAILWIDRVRQRDYSRFTTLRPDDIAALEVYTRAFTVPAEFTAPGSDCGAVVVWTKYAFR